MQRYINQISICLLIGLTVLCCSSCPKGSDDAGNSSAGVASGDSGAAAGNPCGEAMVMPVDASGIFKASNCILCHKEDMSGSGLGPALKNIASEWNREELLKYVRDASKYDDSGKRLSHDPKYTMVMPPFPGSDADLDALVNWLLTK